MVHVHVMLTVCRTEEALGELLKEIQKHSKVVRYEAMANIIANHCQSEGKLLTTV